MNHWGPLLSDAACLRGATEAACTTPCLVIRQGRMPHVDGGLCSSYLSSASSFPGPSQSALFNHFASRLDNSQVGRVDTQVPGVENGRYGNDLNLECFRRWPRFNNSQACAIGTTDGAYNFSTTVGVSESRNDVKLRAATTVLSGHLQQAVEWSDDSDGQVGSAGTFVAKLVDSVPVWAKSLGSQVRDCLLAQCIQGLYILTRSPVRPTSLSTSTWSSTASATATPPRPTS